MYTGGKKTMDRNDKFKFAELKEIPVQKYTISDLVLLLLHSQKETPIFGRISFFKQFFLLYQEVLSEDIRKNSMNPRFVKYNYGPYSFLVADMVEDLMHSNKISVEGRKNSKTESFSITKDGKKEARKILNNIPKNTKNKLMSDLKKRRILWDQLRNEGLLNYVYRNYPEYTSKSKIKNKITYTIWDEGRKG